MVATLALLVPLLVFETRANYRAGQIFAFFLLTYVAVGGFLSTMAAWMWNALAPTIRERG